MRPSRSRVLVRRAAAVFLSVTLGGAALVAGVTRLRIAFVESELASEFAALNAVGVLHEPSARESAELVAARIELARILEGVRSDDALLPAFGAPGVLMAIDTEEQLAELGEGLREREPWLAALDALPDAFWTAASEPHAPVGGARPADYVRRPSDGLADLRAVTNLICAQAFHVGHDLERTDEAGRWLARGLALARATDSGSTGDLMIRTTMESNVLHCAALLCKLEGVDTEVLLRDARRELDDRDECDRLSRALRSELRWLEHQFEIYGARVPNRLRLVEQRRILDRVRVWRALLPLELEARLPELGSRVEDRSLGDKLRIGHVVFSTWRLREERVADFLAGT